MNDIKKQYGIILIILLALSFYIGVRYGEARFNVGTSDMLLSETEDIVGVHIKGAVSKPGYYELPSASRVNDLLSLALPLKNADLSSLNYARYLIDGEEINVPFGKSVDDINIYEKSTAVSLPSISITETQTEPEPQSNAETETETNEKININTATVEELKQLYGIGDAKAEAIINYRENHGLFRDISEIKKVSGIGDVTYEKIRDYICVE